MPVQNEVETARPMTFGKWLVTFMGAYGLMDLALVGLSALAFDIPISHLGFPFVALFVCGFLGATLIYRARQFLAHPAQYARHMSFAVFAFLLCSLWAMESSAVRLSMISESKMLNEDAPYMLPCSAVVAVIVYFGAKRRLQAASTSSPKLNSPREPGQH